MKSEEKEYVWLDGMLLKEEHLVKLAMNVGNYAQAEHYLFALLAHGVVYGKQEILEKVNEVRVQLVGETITIPLPRRDF